MPWGPPTGEGRPAAPPQRARPGTFARSVPRRRRRTERRGAVATPLRSCGGRCGGRSRLGIAPRPSIPRRARRPLRRPATNAPAIRVARRTRNARCRREEGRARSPQRRPRRPGTPRATPRNGDAQRNARCRRVVRPRAGGIPGCPHCIVPTERAGDARRRGATHDAVMGAGRGWRMSRGEAFHCICTQRLRRRPATPSCDAIP